MERGAGKRIRKRSPRGQRTSWDHLATWYDGWVGGAGSEHHQKLVIPVVLELLAPAPGERVLDIGCGQGALAPAISAAQASYVGVDASERLLASARRRHKGEARFIRADATRLRGNRSLDEGSFDAAVFVLSIQNMDPLGDAVAGAGWAMKAKGRLVILMNHPCFRIPRQSGWGWDAGRKLTYRRVDRYLTPLKVPLKPLPNKPPVPTFHRPLEEYFAALAGAGFIVDALKEVAGDEQGPVFEGSRRNRDIPLFLALRAQYVGL